MALDPSIFLKGAALQQQSNKALGRDFGQAISLYQQGRANKKMQELELAKQKASGLNFKNLIPKLLTKQQLGQELSANEIASLRAWDKMQTTDTYANPVSGEIEQKKKSLFSNITPPHAIPSEITTSAAEQMGQYNETPIPANIAQEDSGVTLPSGSSPKTKQKYEELSLARNFEKEKAIEAAKKQETKVKRSLRANIDSNSNVVSAVNDAIKNTGFFSTGALGQITNLIWGGDSKDLESSLNTIQADSAFKTLQDMRDNSKTGGALGAISERELSLLRDAKASLSQDQSQDQLKSNLVKYLKIRNQSLKRTADAFKEDYGYLPDFAKKLYSDDNNKSKPQNNTTGKIKFLGWK